MLNTTVALSVLLAAVAILAAVLLVRLHRAKARGPDVVIHATELTMVLGPPQMTMAEFLAGSNLEYDGAGRFVRKSFAGDTPESSNVATSERVEPTLTPVNDANGYESTPASPTASPVVRFQEAMTAAEKAAHAVLLGVDARKTRSNDLQPHEAAVLRHAAETAQVGNENTLSWAKLLGPRARV